MGVFNDIMDELVNEMANADTALGDFSDKLTNDPASLKVPEEKMKELQEKIDKQIKKALNNPLSQMTN